jgi:hypothetical protein
MPLRRPNADEAGARETPELAALADGSLPPELRAPLEARVAASPELAERLAEQEQAVALARAAVQEVEAPASLRTSIDSRRARTERAPRRLVLMGATAAAAVAAVAIGVTVLGSSSSGTHFRAALGPAGLAPGASGEATLIKTSSGWRIQLDATGLPRLADGRFYEAWLKNPAGVLVPIGTFNEPRNVTLWAGVSPASYKMLTVTREQADGNEASSGQKVLVGPVRTG